MSQWLLLAHFATTQVLVWKFTEAMSLSTHPDELYFIPNLKSATAVHSWLCFFDRLLSKWCWHPLCAVLFNWFDLGGLAASLLLLSHTVGPYKECVSALYGSAQNHMVSGAHLSSPTTTIFSTSLIKATIVTARFTPTCWCAMLTYYNNAIYYGNMSC